MSQGNYFTAVLVGQPNSGKSTLFKVLSDIKKTGSGPTIDMNSTEVNLNGDTLRLFDLPGLFSLNFMHPAEEITYNFLLHQKIDLIINVVDSSLLTRSLELTVELLELGIPMLIALNLEDIANRQGAKIDAELLSSIIKVPVVRTQALFGKGAKDLVDACYQVLKGTPQKHDTLEYTHHLEMSIKQLESLISPHINGHEVSPRFYAIKAIENPAVLSKNIIEHIQPTHTEIADTIFRDHKRDGFESISYERHHISMSISEKICKIQTSRKVPLINKLDNLLLHPVLGYFFLLLFFGFYFFSIFVIGDFLASITHLPLEALAMYIDTIKANNLFLYHTVNGAFQGFAGIIGIVLPYFLPLVLLTSIFEESGYLSRVAFLVDGLMHKIGLHGKSVAPFILGFGCSIPAIYATRMIENRRDRIVTSLLIPFIPCSARIAVIFALAAAFTGPLWAGIIFAYVLLIIAINGKILSKLLSKPIGLVLDIPRLQLPSFIGSLKRTWSKIRDFIKEAFLFLLLGSIALGWIEYLDAAVYLNKFFAPVLSFVLGLPEELGSTLFFGFFRKELILVMANQSLGVHFIHQLPLTVNQVIVFTVFVTFYFPCFTTFVVLWKEYGWKTILLSSLLSFLVAIVSAYLFKIALIGF